ncbi:MAG: ABC transporter substrate-binding protein [Candidatus Paceibacterota bacterium]|jgi:NitT/TauT family transport system substrate-binding protein
MKLFKIGLIIVFITAVVFIARGTSKSEVETIKIGYSVQEAICDAPLIVAYEKGFFKEKGLNVEMVPLKNGGEISQALSSNSLDYGALGMSSLLIPLSKMAPVKVIAPISLFSVDFFVHPNSIKTFSELEGKRIASRPGGSADFVVRYILKQEGVDLSKIKFIDVDRAFRPIALMERGMVDAVAAVSYDTTAFTKSGAVIMKEWEDKGYTNITSVDTSVAMNIAINTNYLKDHESATKRFMEAYIEGHQYMKNNKEESALIIANHTTKESDGAFTYTAEDVLKLWDRQKNIYRLWYEPETLLGLFNIAKDTSIIEYIPTVDEFYDQQFKDELKDNHRQLYE